MGCGLCSRAQKIAPFDELIGKNVFLLTESHRGDFVRSPLCEVGAMGTSGTFRRAWDCSFQSCISSVVDSSCGAESFDMTAVLWSKTQLSSVVGSPGDAEPADGEIQTLPLCNPIGDGFGLGKVYEEKTPGFFRDTEVFVAFWEGVGTTKQQEHSWFQQQERSWYQGKGLFVALLRSVWKTSV